MVLLEQLTSFLDTTLEVQRYHDISLNGLQVEAAVSQQITRVACAVDSGVSIIEKAVAGGAQFLLVHHGLFWGRLQPVTGTLGRQIRGLLSGGCSLYTAHLPLDGHPELGNGAQLAKHIGMKKWDGFFPVDGMPVGVIGEMDSPQSLEQFGAALRDLPGTIPPIALPFGPAEIRRVAVVTGSGTPALIGAKEAGADILISGEGKQEAYHLAKDLGMNALFAGHYATETFGVRAVAEVLNQRFGVETFFVDEPTGF